MYIQCSQILRAIPPSRKHSSRTFTSLSTSAVVQNIYFLIKEKENPSDKCCFTYCKTKVCLYFGIDMCSL